MRDLFLVKALKKISREITEQISFPNQGGCAVIAAIVGREVAKYTEVYAIVVPAWFTENSSINEVRQKNDVRNFTRPSDWHNVNVHFHHVRLKIKIGERWVVFDSNGIFEYNPIEYVDGWLTMDEVLTIASKSEGWNEMFGRWQIPKIGRIVHKAFCY